MVEAFLAIQAMYGLAHSDPESTQSDISETLGAQSFQRRPGSGRRKKQVPLRSPWDASVSTEHVSQDSPKEPLRSRLDLSNDGETSDPATPTAAAVAGTAYFEPTPVGTPRTSTPNSTSRNKKTKQDLAGPCCHCNATNSPQWRKGPKGKPILCNACGIRFLRTRTLGKAVPKKRRHPVTHTAAAAAGVGGSVESDSRQSKRIRIDEPSTEEDEYDVAADEAVAMDDGPAAAAAGAQEAHSNSETNIDPSFLKSAGLAAAAAAVGHQTPHSRQHRMIRCATSRLAIGSSASKELSDITTSGEAAAAAAAAAAAGQAKIYQQQYNGAHGQRYSQTCGQTYGQTAVDQVVECCSEQLAEQYTGSTAAAVDLGDLVPQYEWPALSVHPWGPHAAAAANHSNIDGSSSRFGCGMMAPVAGGINQPLAAGSRLLLGASSSSGGSSSSRLVQSPSLAYALAVHQQHSSSSCNPPQQQHSSGKVLGHEHYSLSHRSGCSGSPMSHSSAFPQHLRAEYSGFSLASGSPPASPLTLGAAAGACAGSSGSGFSSRGNEGFSSGVSTQQYCHQQQQHGMHRPSPLSVMATAADLAQHAATSARQFHAATSAQHHADLAPQNADLASAEAAAAVNVQQAQGVDVLQLMRHMANALGGVGPTWNLLQSLQTSGAGGPNAATAALGLLNSACLMQQQ